MLLQMALILGIVGVITEVMLVHGVGWIKRLYTHGGLGIKGVVWNTIGSFLISYGQGIMFGATGLVIAMSGAISTGISQLYFTCEEAIEKAYGDETILKFLKRFVAENKVEIQSKISDGVQMLRDAWKICVFILRVITFPFRAYRSIKSNLINFKESLPWVSPKLVSSP